MHELLLLNHPAHQALRTPPEGFLLPQKRSNPVAVKMPRFTCPGCARDVAGLPTKRIGYASLADHKIERRALVLCGWSESHVPLEDALYRQEQLPEDAGTPEVLEQRIERLPLF